MQVDLCSVGLGHADRSCMYGVSMHLIDTSVRNDSKQGTRFICKIDPIIGL